MKCLLPALVALPLLAQIPGQYPTGSPYPGGGRYPNPNGGPTGTPNGRPVGVGRGGDGRQTDRRSTAQAAVVTTTEGLLRRFTTGQIVLESTDHRIIWYRLSDKITYQEDGKELDTKSLQPGDQVSVDSTADDQDVYTAISLVRRGAATPEDRAAVNHAWDLPRGGGGTTREVARNTSPTREPGDDRPILRRNRPAAPEESPKEAEPTKAPEQRQAQPEPKPQAQPEPKPEEDLDPRAATTVRPADPKPDEDDPGRPVLRRGPNAARVSSAKQDQPAPVAAPKPAVSPSAESRPAPPAPVADRSEIIPVQEDAVIAKAREASQNYSEGLPNYFAKQFTTRYQTENVKRGWNAQDVVSADIAYEDGRESYKNIKIGNKATTKSMDDLPGGANSTGEFATMLNQIFGGPTNFRRSGTDTVRGHSVYVYSFDIPREQARWRIESPSQLYYPAYGGKIYIDRETSRVLRIEQDARKMPPLFPFDKVESSAEYDFVRLEVQTFLLPVESEVLMCQRNTSICMRNKIEFRNYRKFGAESDITFSDKQ